MTKRVIAKETILACPNFNKPFQTHTDASHCHLGAVTSQEGKPMALCSRKLNPAQKVVHNCGKRTAEHSRDSQGMSEHAPWTAN